jgi:predicted nucleotidyltransferase
LQSEDIAVKNTLKVLNEIKEKGLIRDYAIGGAIAALRWTEPFFTQDLDVFILLEKEANEKGLIDLSPVYEYLRSKGYVWKGHWIMIEGIPVDIFPADPLEKEAVEQAEEAEYEGVRTKVIVPEYLIALFLRAGRDKDLRKMEMLLEQCEIDKERLQRILSRYGLHEKFRGFEERRRGI